MFSTWYGRRRCSQTISSLRLSPGLAGIKYKATYINIYLYIYIYIFMFVCFIGLCSADTVDFRIFLFFKKVLGI